MSSDAKYIFGFIICITCFMDSILKWVVSQSWFNFFKFKIIQYDPSFLDRIKRFEKKSPSWTYVVIITFFRMSLRTSSSITLCSSCDRLYSNGKLVRMSLVKLSFRPCCTRFKMNVSDVMFVQARKLFLKLPPWNLSALMHNFEISMLKFTCFNNPFSCFVVDMSCVVVCCNCCCPCNVSPFGSFGSLTSFVIDMTKTVAFAYYFHCFSFLPYAFHRWLIKQVLLTGIWLWKLF